MNSQDRLEISWDDLTSVDVESRVEQMRQAQAAPLVRSVGAPDASAASSAWWRGGLASLALAGLLGGLVAWALVEFINIESDDDATVSNILFTIEAALGIGLVIAAWEGIQIRSAAKTRDLALRALPVLGGIGLVAGWITDKVYSSMIQDLGERAVQRAMESGDIEDAYQYLQDNMHVPRGIAFAMVGVAIGLALGAASQSSKRALNAAIGGLVGGFLGGFVFDYVGEATDSGVAARVVAISLCGIVIGVGVGVVEAVRKENWLEIVTGGMAGKQFILYHDATVLGSSPECHVTLIKDPALAGQHATLQRTPRGLTVRALNAGAPVYVNGAPVADAALVDGDLVQLGSTVLRYKEKAAAAPVAGPILG